MKKLFGKRVLSAVVALALSLSVFAAFSLPATAEEMVPGEKSLTIDDIQLLYYQGDIANAQTTDKTKSVLTVGEKIEDNDAVRNKQRIMDGSLTDPVVVGTSSGPKRYLIVDLGENHKSVSKIKIKDVQTAIIVGLTNTISETNGDTIQLAYAKRVNNTNVSDAYGSDDISLASAASSYEANAENSSYCDYTFDGDDIGKYRYIVLSSNNNGSARFRELELTYQVEMQKSLKATDVTLRYFYGKLAEADRTITVGTATGTEITSGGDYNKLKNLMDGVADSDEAAKECYIGAGGDNNRYIIVDLGENHKPITNIKLTNITNTAVLGLTNAIASETDGAITVDYSVRGNGDRLNNPNNLDVSVSRTESVLNTAKSDTVLTGEAIGDYRYIILHSNGSGARLAELTLSYDVIPEGAKAMITTAGVKKYYDDLPSAVAASAAGETLTLLDDVTLSAALDIADNKNLIIEGGNHTITTPQRIEYKANGTLTLKNLTITGGGNLNIPGSNKIIADNIKVDRLENIGGSTSAKGTISNSEISKMTIFGKIVLENTKVTTVELKKIDASGGDVPKITADSASAVTTLSAENVVFVEGVEFPYVLLDGDLKAIAGEVKLPEGYAFDANIGAIKVVGAPGTYSVTAPDGIAVDKIFAAAGDTVTVTVSDTEHFVASSLIAKSTSGLIALTEGADSTYTFTMPEEEVTLSALFNTEDTQIVVASKDKSYNAANGGGTYMDIHYISYKSDGKYDIALGFDLTGVALNEHSNVVLKLYKKGNSLFEKTNVNLIPKNPWETDAFNYAAASGAGNRNLTSQANGVSYAEGEVSFELGQLTGSDLVNGELFLNIAMAEENTNNGNDYYALPVSGINEGHKASNALYLPRLEITTAEPHNITTQDGITASVSTAKKGETITLFGNYASGSLIIKAGETLISPTKNSDGTYSFVMPNADVAVTGLVNTEDKIYVVPTSIERVNGKGQTDNNNYFIHINRGLGMTFEIPEYTVPAGKDAAVNLHFMRSNGATSQKTNVYDQTASGFSYVNGGGYIAQYNGGSVDSLKLKTVPNKGEYKLLLSYDSEVTGDWGNDYYVINATHDSKLPKEVSQLPYLVISFRDPAPAKQPPSYELQTDTEDETFQYHYAGGTTEYNNGTTATGKAYDAYLWVPQNTAPGELKGLVAIKMNLVEVPFANSAYLREELAKKNFGILFLVCQKENYGYNNTLNAFYTREDYAKNPTTMDPVVTTDGKDAADILNEILSGVAEVSGYSEIKDTVPLITIGHSAASGFGNKSANWDPDRVIAQIHMKNGMSGEEAMVPGVPQLQYAAQYTEHSNGADRDRSVRDARYHIRTKRAVNTDYLVSHIIEWGSGHYDWSDNATYMLTKYITKAIDARLPEDYTKGSKLNDLTKSGYLMKPFEKDASGNEQEEGYYRDYLQGWLSSGQSNASASEADKQASFWFFDETFANEVNKFTNYAIPESPDSRETGVTGRTSSEMEPFMLMKDPTLSTYADTPASALNLISPYMAFNGGMSRYGNNRFVNYIKMASPNSSANNAANLGGYDTITVDAYYMNKIPSVTSTDKNGTYISYDGAGAPASYPQGQKAEFVPLIAPYEVVDSELLDMSDMTADSANAEAANAASATRTTLRFHNNRVYYRSGTPYMMSEADRENITYTTSEGKIAYSTMDSYGFIKSPEVRNAEGFVTSPFKATSSQMNVPYVNKGTAQTITLDKIDDVNVLNLTENPKFAVNFTSTDAELQKYTDVFVEYGPAKAVRTVNADGSYSWQIEILLNQIPKGAAFPIEVNVVVSNLGKWEKVYGASASQTFKIISETKPSEIVIGDITQGTDKTTVSVSVANPTEETNGGTLIVAVYGAHNECVQTKIVTDGTAEFDKVTTGYVKAFLWDSRSGMQPLLESKRKDIE